MDAVQRPAPIGRWKEYRRSRIAVGATGKQADDQMLDDTTAVAGMDAAENRNISLCFLVEDVSIEDAVRLSDGSNRLLNSLTRALKAECLPVRTIGEFLAAPLAVRNSFLDFRGFGRKTQGELEGIIDRWDRAAVEAVDFVDLARRVIFQERQFSDDELEGRLRDVGVSLRADRTEVMPVRRTPAHYRSKRASLCDMFDDVAFPDCVLPGQLSTRLRNALDAFRISNGQDCNSLGVFLGDERGWVQGFCLQKNIGEKVRNEFLRSLDACVVDILTSSGMSDTLATTVSGWLLCSDQHDRSISDDQWRIVLNHKEAIRAGTSGWAVQEDSARQIDRIEEDPEVTMRTFIWTNMGQREFDILNRRFGIDVSERSTLEKIAGQYGVTRERIRQIENRAIARIRVPVFRNLLEVFLETQRDAMLATLVSDASVVSITDAAMRQRDLTGLQRLVVKVVYGSFKEWLDEKLTVIWQGDQRTGWMIPSVDTSRFEKLKDWLLHNAESTKGLPWRIRSAARRGRWPLTFASFQESLPDVPEAALMQCLVEQMGATFENDRIVSLPNLTSSARLVLTLRESGRPQHVKEIGARHHALFGIGIDDHAARAVLQRLEEVVIVERGTYSLYEFLGLNAAGVTAVRDACYALLLEKKNFVSAKILRRKVAARLRGTVATHLTPYLLLGLCQDDPRFIARRGLMIGLADRGFEEHFSPLSDTILNVVKTDGPTTIAAIRETISHARDVLGVSVNVILKNNPGIVMRQRGVYDVVENVIGDEAAVERLGKAIEIGLIVGPTDIGTLAVRLAAVGLNFNSVTLLSFVRNQAAFVIEAGSVELVAPSKAVLDYNRVFTEVFDPSRTRAGNRTAMQQSLAGSDSCRLLSLDHRITGPD